MNPQATAGRIVHYCDDDGATIGLRAAIIVLDTFPSGRAPELHVFGRHGLLLNVAYSEVPSPGCWSWMPYQKAKAATAEGNESESAEPRPLA